MGMSQVRSLSSAPHSIKKGNEMKSFQEFITENTNKRTSAIERKFKDFGISPKPAHKMQAKVWELSGYKFVLDGDTIDIKKGTKTLDTWQFNSQFLDTAVEKFVELTK